MGNTDSTSISLDEQLRDACYDGDIEAAKSLLSQGANIHSKGGGNWTSLHNATLHGHTEIVRLLLDKGSNVNLAADNGSTPLHLAAYYGHGIIVKLLIENKADLYAKDKIGNTPLDEAKKKLPNTFRGSSLKSSIVTMLNDAMEEDFMSFFGEIDQDRAKKLIQTIREHDETISNIPSLKRFYNEIKGDREDEHDAFKELGIAKVADRIVIIKALQKAISSESEGPSSRQSTNGSTSSNSSSIAPTSSNPSEDRPPSSTRERKPASYTNAPATAPQDSSVGRRKKQTSRMNSQDLIDEQRRQHQQAGIETLDLPSEYKYHAFLTHNWGAHDHNHKRVSKINHYLKQHGVITWFDDDRMQGNIANQMSRGISSSMTVIVFITEDYITKVAGEADNGDNDNCKLEFEYACEHKGVKNLIVVEMEETEKPWRGSVGLYAGKLLSYSYKKKKHLASCIRSLINEIEQRVEESVEEDDVVGEMEECHVNDGEESRYGRTSLSSYTPGTHDDSVRTV